MPGVLNMKKRIILFGGVLSFLISVYFKRYHITIIIILLGMLLAVLLSLKKSKVTDNWNKMPDFLKDDTRNYSNLELGYERVGKDGLDLTQKYTNLYSDYLILKRFYSLVKKDGTIVINMKPTEYYMFHSRPSVFSLCMLHPVTLLELGKIYYIYEIVFWEILNPFLFMLKEMGMQFIKNKETNVYNESLMQEIEEFCNARNLRVEWYMLGKGIKDMTDIQKMVLY